MKLISANVRRYRSIEDGSDVAIESDVTCMVGKNESGKSAVLQAIYKSHPVEKSSKFDAGIDFPSRLTRERKDNPKIPVTVLTYELSDDDMEFIEKKFGPDVLLSRDVAVTNGYGYTSTTWSGIQVDEIGAVAFLAREIDAPSAIQKLIDTAKTTAELLEILVPIEAPAAPIAAAIATIKGWRGEDLVSAIISALAQRRPKFVYFSDYDTMPGKVSIPDLIRKRDEDEASRGELGVMSLLSMAGVTLEDFLEPETHEHLIRDLENASNSISDEVFEYWSQNKNLAVKLTPIGVAETGALPPLNAAPLLQIRVENQRHRVTVPFDERSRGFVWFFSFLAYFSQLEAEAEQPLILLLDEPGINLHASAQADLLRFIDERLAPSHQVIFSTHSPFMINPHALGRVRTVVDVDNQGTKVSSDVLYSDAETSFPLHAAIGVELAQTLFVAPDVLLVEGPSDVIYLEVLSNALLSVERVGLDPRWAITPVGGASKLPAFLTLLGANRLNAAILADSPFEDSGTIDRLRKTGRLGAAGVVSIGEIVGAAVADVEDLFEPSLYVDLVSDAYAGALGNKRLKVGDLSSGERLVGRVEEYFRTNSVNSGRLNHFAPASALLRGQPKYVGKLNEATLDRAEKLFKKINTFLSN
ncbi:AAA family ATPase [Salinibacterium sp. SWN139]|uniref:AAA family ATPase n=1 Tax=Salinibacterium sp. SWN139 TaxID=2792055 RepID=UPI0018CDA778|nr:AAA family ATPase [Salinibacterium sp. SWN139]MBH0053617.1 AAA family ATPase [Salinibacterium sp. SWN139]